jgi:hypothetical protein
MVLYWGYGTYKASIWKLVQQALAMNAYQTSSLASNGQQGSGDEEQQRQ